MLLFFIVGIIAQLVDGSLGMAYGLTASSFLLAAGVPPAHTSASVHLAKFFTTGVSGAAHAAYRNVDWRLFWRLALAGGLGGVGGVYVLTSVDGAIIKPFIIVYLALLGVLILRRMLNTPSQIDFTARTTVPLGMAGGFFDAIGGGGWGPIVTTSLIARGGEPRFVIGSVNASEFVVTIAIGAALITAFVTGQWRDAAAIADYAAPIAGLIGGGLLAAPVAGKFVAVIPRKVLGFSVGGLVLGSSAFQALSLARVL